MKIKLINKAGYHSKIENQNGNYIDIDNKSDINPKGVSPMELLLMGVAGCSSIDIISILKKQKQEFKNLYIEVEGKREDGELPSLFTQIHADVFIEGEVDSKKAYKASELSFTKYCHSNDAVFVGCSKERAIGSARRIYEA